MNFVVRYPLFLVGKLDPDNIALIDLVNGEATAKGMPVFTDKEGAEEFRDTYHASFIVLPLPSEAAFARLLTLFRDNDIVSEVVFDPYRNGKRPQTIPVAEMLEQLPPAAQN